MFIFELARDHGNDAVIAVAGDWHGHTVWAKKAVEMVAARNVSLIVHVGDFGVQSSAAGKKYLIKLDEHCEQYGVDIVVVPGNHEHWGRLSMLWENQRARGEQETPLSLHTRHIRILPRPYWFEISGKRFLALGGAASVDVDGRTEGVDWWPEEMLTEDHVARAIEGGAVDIMISHETPDDEYAVGQVRTILQHNPMGFSRRGLSASAQSRRRLTRVVEQVKPDLLFHGHMHVSDHRVFHWDEENIGAVVALDREFTNGNLAYVEFAKYQTTLREMAAR